MIPDIPTTWLTAALALLGVLAVLALLARGARLAGFAPAHGAGARRRLALQEVLALDARRRLLLVRCDGREMLLLTGGGQDAVVGWVPREGGA